MGEQIKTAQKAKLENQAPILMVRNIEASITYWMEKIGFSAQAWGNPIDFCILNRDRCFLMLSQAPEGADLQPNWRIKNLTWNAYIWVDDAKALYEELTASGAHIDYHLGEKAYGCLEFGIQDLDDHDIAFGQVLTQTEP